jgi:hypothetical protein
MGLIDTMSQTEGMPYFVRNRLLKSFKISYPYVCLNISMMQGLTITKQGILPNRRTAVIVEGKHTFIN